MRLVQKIKDGLSSMSKSLKQNIWGIKNKVKGLKAELSSRTLGGFFLSLIILKYRTTSFMKEINEIKKISMLHPNVLILLYYFAKKVKGSILEIGPYIGGSSIAICKGVKQNPRKVTFVSIEKGGQHLSHPAIPSKDIYGDLKKNLRKFKVKPFVKLMHGHSNNPRLVKEVKNLLNGEKISLLLVDADGNIKRDFKNYFPFCKKGCILIIDDYLSDYVPEKVLPTKKYIDVLVKKNKIELFDIFGYGGTWIGKIRDTNI
jgi:predicted O-methyltransferase YrrM